MLSFDCEFTGSRYNKVRNNLAKFINDTLMKMEKFNLKDDDHRKLNDLIDIIVNYQDDSK